MCQHEAAEHEEEVYSEVALKEGTYWNGWGLAPV
jgi:hypothetical protein